MATTNTPSTGEISHLSVDDLFAPLPETIRLGGPGPFVINLSTSGAPIAMPAKNIAGAQPLQVYQVQRTEDRRPRYRLRLGPFVNEDEADAALKKVRDVYPGALTATADAEDLRSIAAARTKSRAQQPAAAKSSLPAVAPAPAARPTTVPPARPTTMPAAAAPAAPAAPSQAVAVKPLDVEGDQASRWFAIQLSLAEEPFDPDSVPNLDIFGVYRLYSVAGIDQGRIVHALRLGFFTEEIAARAVASYLAAFYAEPAIKRVSSAERQRFAEQPLEPRKDVGVTGKQAVIEITSER
jgi:hypothetical protein